MAKQVGRHVLGRADGSHKATLTKALCHNLSINDRFPIFVRFDAGSSAHIGVTGLTAPSSQVGVTGSVALSSGSKEMRDLNIRQADDEHDQLFHINYS